MGAKTGIEWTDATWNPIRGCTRVSEGCRNCYAESTAYRFSGPGKPYEGLAVLRNGHASWTGKVEFVEEHLLDPLRWGPVHGGTAWPSGLKEQPATWTRSRRIFVNSMSDLFHENVSDELRDRIFAVMALCPQHTFQVLTKRPERMLDYIFGLLAPKTIGRIAVIAERIQPGGKHTPEWLRNYAYQPGFDSRREILALPNVWLGVSVENQAAADERIPLLLKTPAAVRFISAEPLLGPVSFRWKNSTDFGVPHPRHSKPLPDSEGRVSTDEYDGLRELDWVICGGESGPHARPMHPDWARSLRDQCKAAGVPFFFKQWGEWARLEDHRGLGWKFGDERTGYFSQDAPGLYEWNHRGVASHGAHMLRVGKHAAGALLDGREWHEAPGLRGAAC